MISGIYLSRKRKNRNEITPPEPVQIPDNAEDSDGNIESACRVHELDLNRAITAAVYRAILRGDAQLELTVKLPEKCQLFGHEVDADGIVRIKTRQSRQEQGEQEPGTVEDAPLF